MISQRHGLGVVLGDVAKRMTWGWRWPCSWAGSPRAAGRRPEPRGGVSRSLESGEAGQAESMGPAPLGWFLVFVSG